MKQSSAGYKEIMPPVLINEVPLMEPDNYRIRSQMYHIVSENFYLVQLRGSTDEHIQGYYS